MADAIYEGRHGQLEAEAEEDYEDYEAGEEDLEFDESEFVDPEEEEETEE